MGFWRGKRILLTGHTGFKGAWLHFWLKQFGAHVQGLSLAPNTEPALFDLLANDGAHPKGIVDIRDRAAVLARVAEADPEIVFHLAAQPLVRAGYREPVETFETNVQGTVNLLDALRAASDLRSVVVVTTDKVYENPEGDEPFRERDPLGGHDPYSASKAAADIVTASYRRSFFLTRKIGLATARAGNVIGGGDWAADRLIPDAVRALTSGLVLDIRRPNAVRPWQHVLEPLNGYMLLAQKLWNDPEAGPAYNFGPDPASTATVRQMLELSARYFELGSVAWGDGSEGPHEAGLLTLDSAKAEAELSFRPKFSLDQTVERTWKWYGGLHEGKSASDLCLADLIAYEAGHFDTVQRVTA